MLDFIAELVILELREYGVSGIADELFDLFSLWCPEDIDAGEYIARFM